MRPTRKLVRSPMSTKSLTRHNSSSGLPLISKKSVIRINRKKVQQEVQHKKSNIPSFLSRVKLIKPVILNENKIGIREIGEKIHENYTKFNKWTIIRDLHSISIKKFLSYNSTVIEMDEFTAFSALSVKTKIDEAMERGTWVTLYYRETLCSISKLVRNNVVPEDILKPGSLMMPFDDRFRLIFVSSKLEYPKSMLDSCVLIGIEDEKLKIEKQLTKFKRVRGINKKDPSQMHKENEFIEACFEGEIEKVKEMLQIPWLNANTMDLHMNTALMEAALKGNLNVCKLLISHSDGEEVQEAPEVSTEIHCPKIPNLKKLDINAVNPDGKTALHKAAYNGSATVIKLLLLNGADPDIVDSNGNKPINYINNLEAKFIMKKWKPEWAQKYKMMNNIKSFENPDEIDVTQLSKNMKKKLQEFLVEKAKNGEYTKIYNLISKGKATIETKNSEGQSLLSLAVVYGHFDCVYRMLKDFSPNVNSKDSKGWTPLMNAAYNGHLRIAKLLLSHDADINIKNDQNMRALDLAQGTELKNYLIQETRNAHIYDFEQILELSMTNASTKNIASLSSSYKIDHEEEEGNRSLFDKMSKEKKSKNRQKQKSGFMQSPNLKAIKKKSRVFSSGKSSTSNLRVRRAIQNQRQSNMKSQSKLSTNPRCKITNLKAKKKRWCFSPDITAKNSHFLLFDHI